MELSRRIRDLPGVLFRDVPRFVSAIAQSGTGRQSAPDGWISLSNRHEPLLAIEGQRGFRCDWRWGSELHAARVLPFLGRAVMRAALNEWPIRYSDFHIASNRKPSISFVIAHEGEDRLLQLRQTIRSLFAQEETPCEFIVVDQSDVPVFRSLPDGIVYRHLDKGGLPPGWRKSWAFNVGARLASADILVFHDGDISAPIGYAREVERVLRSGVHGAASLQRMLFYFGKTDTHEALEDGGLPQGIVPESIRQNWKGGTIAVRRDAFSFIGGFDEGFVDWGGEDDEFYDRCGKVGHCRSGYIPFIHLWHPSQPGRAAADNPNTSQVLPRRLAIPVESRISELRSRNWGNSVLPDPSARYG